MVFNYHLKDALDILLETFEKKMVLNQEVYINVLKNLYKKLNSRYALKADLSQEEYEEYLRLIMKNMGELKIELDPKIMKEIEETGLEETDGIRRCTDQSNKRASAPNKGSFVYRRTIY